MSRAQTELAMARRHENEKMVLKNQLLRVIATYDSREEVAREVLATVISLFEIVEAGEDQPFKSVTSLADIRAAFECRIRSYGHLL